MSIFGRVLGTKKAIDDITDKDSGLLVKAGGWVNGLSFTDQEKAEHNIAVREWGLKQLVALEPFKVVQRIIVFGIMSVWMTIGFSCVFAIIAQAFINMPTTTIIDGVSQVTQNNLDLVDPLLRFAFSDFILWPSTACFSLYLGGGFLESRAASKKGDKK